MAAGTPATPAPRRKRGCIGTGFLVIGIIALIGVILFGWMVWNPGNTFDKVVLTGVPAVQEQVVDRLATVFPQPTLAIVSSASQCPSGVEIIQLPDKGGEPQYQCGAVAPTATPRR